MHVYMNEYVCMNIHVYIYMYFTNMCKRALHAHLKNNFCLLRFSLLLPSLLSQEPVTRSWWSQHSSVWGWGVVSAHPTSQCPSSPPAQHYSKSKKTHTTLTHTHILNTQARANLTFPWFLSLCAQNVIVGALVTWAIYTQGQLLLWSRAHNLMIVGALVTWAIYTQGQLLLWSSLIITGVVPGYK